MLESEIQKTILEDLKKKRKLGLLFYSRANSGKVKTRGGYVQLLPNGFPDIFIILKGGKFIGMELKQKKGAVRESQIKMKGEFEALGLNYYIIRDFNSYLTMITSEIASNPHKTTPE